MATVTTRAAARCSLSAVRLITVAAIVLLGSAAAAQTKFETPTLTAPVNDFAGIIDAASEAEMDRRIRSLLAASGDVVVVATVKTFKPFPDINQYAVKMFENGGRGIGAKGKDNGVLVVVAMDERAIRVEVGYDLEQFITDGFAGETIRGSVAPQFRNGNYGAGLLAGTTRIINRIAEGRNVTLQDVPREQPRARNPSGGFPSWIIPIVILIWIMSSRGGGRRRRRRYWGGPWSGWSSGVGPFGGGRFGGGFGGFGGGGFGGGGGGFGGFGGGRSGGGGASGGW